MVTTRPARNQPKIASEKYSVMHKDLKDLDQFERSKTKMAALGRDKKRLDPSSRDLTVLARISERSCQTLLIRSITTKIEMTCLSYKDQCKNRAKRIKGFAILFFNEVFILITERLAGKVSTVLPFDKWGFPCIFYPFVERCWYLRG